jgi:hypothetical protein
MKIPLTSLLVLLTLSSVASAQVQMQMQQVQIQQNRPGLGGGDPADLEAAMRIEVDTIRRVTGLSDAATKKLEVAAMAAVKNAFKKAQEVKFALPGTNDDASPGQAGNTLSDEDAERSDKNSGKGKDPQMLMPAMQVLDVKKVKEETIWSKSFANALSSDQMVLYEKHLVARANNRRTSAIESKVNDLDEALSFTAEQRKLVTELVDRKLGDVLANQARPAGMFGGGQMIVMMAGQQHADLAADDLKPILSEVQMVELKRKQDLAAQGPFGALRGLLPPALQGQLGLPTASPSSMGFSFVEKEQGLEVVSVDDNSEASKMGLMVGDIVDAVQEMPVDTAIQLKRAVNKRTKELIKIRVKRGGQIVELTTGETK